MLNQNCVPTRELSVAVALVATLVALIVGCSKPNRTDTNPYHPPSHDQLDRNQEVINARPDLEVVKQQLIDLDGTIRATIAKYAPKTVLDPSNPRLDHGCSGPFDHNIGDTYAIETAFGKPAPTPQQWRQITTTLDPVFRAAGFKPETEVVASQGGPPPPPGSQDDVQVRDDGARIDLVGGGNGNVMNYSYSTGCHLPAAWRTGLPPPELRPPNDPAVHYPYLVGPPGGRTAAP
jgi:Lipoprotein confined to pathogenic Mycobacterium